MDIVKRIIQWLVVILVPVILVLSVVRLMLTPLFVRAEYNTPNFPADKYGFSLEERLHWSEIALQYLLNSEGIEFLGDLTFEDGSPLYNEREQHHMLDVKIVVQQAMVVLAGALTFVILVGVWARGTDRWWEYRQSLSRGGWLTVGIIGLVIVAIVLSFDVFFVAFHKVFFEGETWIFRYSDTLIRLFPVRFWRDTFIAVGGITLTGGAALGVLCKRNSQEP